MHTYLRIMDGHQRLTVIALTRSDQTGSALTYSLELEEITKALAARYKSDPKHPATPTKET